MVDVERFNLSRAVALPVASDVAYAMVADITRMGEWSPVCKVCTWDDAASTGLGAWFTGKNVVRDFEWETHCEVVAATPGEEFAWIVGGADEGVVRWGYRFRAVGDGCEVEESWRISRLRGPLGEMSDDDADALVARTTKSIERTLANLEAASNEAPELAESN